MCHFHAKNGLKLTKNCKICEITYFQILKIGTKNVFLSLKIPVIDDLESEKQNMHENFAFSKIFVSVFLNETVLFWISVRRKAEEEGGPIKAWIFCVMFRASQNCNNIDDIQYWSLWLKCVLKYLIFYPSIVLHIIVSKNIQKCILVWVYLQACWTAQLVMDLFVQHQRFAVCCP